MGASEIVGQRSGDAQGGHRGRHTELAEIVLTRTPGRSPAQTGGAGTRLQNSGLGKVVRRHGVDDRPHARIEQLFVVVRAEAAQIGASSDGGDDVRRDCRWSADATHVEPVSDHGTIEAEPTKHADDRPARGGRLVVERRHQQMPGHHGVDPGGDRGAEGHELPCIEHCRP